MHFSLPSNFRKPRRVTPETKTTEEVVEVTAVEPVEVAARKAPKKRVKKAGQ